MEKTFIMIKPDGIKRGLTGNIIQRYEQKGLKIIAAKLCNVTKNWLKNTIMNIFQSHFSGNLLLI